MTYSAMSILAQYRRDRSNGRRSEVTRAQAVECAVVRIHNRGEMPTPRAIAEELGDRPHRQGGGISLNGRDTYVRTRVLESLGYTQPEGYGSRWVRP